MAEPANSESGFSAQAVGSAVVQPYRELTISAVLLGLIQGVILNMAFVYAALMRLNPHA